MKRASCAVVVLAEIVAGCASTPEQRGAAEARRDVEHEELAYRVRGWGEGMERPYVLFVQERYGVSIRQVGGCLVLVDDANFDWGYNQVSLAAIEQQKGPDVLQNARDAWKDLGAEGRRPYVDRAEAEFEREMAEARRRDR